MLLRASDMNIANTYFQKEDKYKVTHQKKTTQKVVHPGTQSLKQEKNQTENQHPKE